MSLNIIPGFGDSETSTEQNPSHEYQSAGEYTVSLTVTGPGGQDTETKEQYIHISDSVCGCTMVPDTTVIPRGGAVGFDVTITNNTDGQGFAYFATTVTLPDQSRYPASGYLDGPYKILLTPNNSVSGHISHTIPMNAQSGDYVYHGYLGIPGNVLDECEFSFEVVP